MIINANSSNFLLTFPKTFFSEKTARKFDPYIKRLPIPYDTIQTYMASTIQAVTFPSWDMEPVVQTRTLGKKQEYKNSVPLEDLVTREVTVTFKSLSGYINYWILVSQVNEYMDFKNPNEYTDDLQMRFLDQEGYVVTTCLYKGVYIKSISELNLSYSDNEPAFKNFTMTMGFYSMEILIEKD